MKNDLVDMKIYVHKVKKDVVDAKIYVNNPKIYVLTTENAHIYKITLVAKNKILILKNYKTIFYSLFFQKPSLLFVFLVETNLEILKQDQKS